jgi:hypothetical protein
MNTTGMRTSRSGFTVLELAIGATILLLLVGSLMQSVSSMSRGATYASIDSELQAMSERAIRSILRTMKPSGFAIVGPDRYPYLFVDGNAVGNFAASAHAPAAKHGVAGDADFGPNQEIVFVQPLDADADDRPDIDANGSMIWAGNQFAYVLVTRADGVNVLQRRIDGGTPRDIANHVERVTFDDNTTSGGQVPLRALRVRIWFRRTDEKGAVHRLFSEAMVKLRNG